MKRTRSKSDPLPWETVTDEHLQHCKVFDVHRSLMQSPRTGVHHAFFRIESAEWVNVVPVTKNDEFVLIRQWRHGSRIVTLEIPGGLVDPGESPEQAGARELLEETGYRAGSLVSLGSLSPNPALFTNRVHMFAAQDCVVAGEIQNSATEETIVELLPRALLPDLLRNGGIDHALVVASLYAYELWRSRSD